MKVITAFIGASIALHPDIVWRSNRYLNEGVSAIFLIYEKLLKVIYDKFSGSQCKPGEPNYMSRDELNKLCDVSGLFNNICGERESDIAFVLS